MENVIAATNETIREIVLKEVSRLGNDADLNHIDVSGVTDMTGVFENTKFVGNISEWDVSNVTIMKNMFSDSLFDGNLSKWNVSKVVDMSSMFERSNYSGVFGDISEWDVHNVTTMYAMFISSKYCGDISKWDVSNVTNMKFMFMHTSDFNCDISNWDIYNVNDFDFFINDAKAFNQNLSSWKFNRKVSHLSFCEGCTILRQYLPLWFNQKVSDNENCNFDLYEGDEKEQSSDIIENDETYEELSDALAHFFDENSNTDTDSVVEND